MIDLIVGPGNVNTRSHERNQQAKSLGYLAANDANEEQIKEGVSVLIDLVSVGTFRQTPHVAHALALLATDSPYYQDMIRDKGGIEPLIHLATYSGTPTHKWRAAMALSELAIDNPQNQLVIGRLGGIWSLIEIIKRDTSESRSRMEAAWALSHLALLPQNQNEFKKHEGVQSLINYVDQNLDQGGYAAMALSNLALHEGTKMNIINSNGIQALLKLAKNGKEVERNNAIAALARLCVDQVDNAPDDEG